MSRPASSQRGGGGSGGGGGVASANHQSRTASPALSNMSKASSNNAGSNASTGAAAAPTAAASSTAAQNQQNQQQQQINASLKSLLGKPVVLTLAPTPPSTESTTEQGLLWAHDVQMDLAVLEIPRGFPSAATASSQSAANKTTSASKASSTVSFPYPTNAAAYPTPQLSSLKVAAQGGDSGSSRTNFSLIKLRRITAVKPLSEEVLSSSNSSKLTLTPCRDVNVQAAEARERAATGEALKRAAKIGVGVSKLGQDVFDALSKTLPCRWADQHIVVMDEIVISPADYDKAHVPQMTQEMLQALADGKDVPNAPSDGKQKATRWQRVSKVLEGERRKLANRPQ